MVSFDILNLKGTKDNEAPEGNPIQVAASVSAPDVQEVSQEVSAGAEALGKEVPVEEVDELASDDNGEFYRFDYALLNIISPV